MIGSSKNINKKKLKKEILFLCFLVVVFIINVVIVNKDREEDRKVLEKYREQSTEENILTESTEAVVSSENSTNEAVPNFGTEFSITNIEDVAVPMLESKASLLEVKLSEYVKEKSLEVTSGEILHVMIPEDNVNQLYFFCKISAEEIVLLVFDRISDTVTAAKCDYSEEEILNEVWEGIAPSDRDIQE